MNKMMFDKIKFVVVSFEFTQLNKNDLLLILGSISNTLEKYKPIKLEGKPIVLTTTNKLKMLQHQEIKYVMQNVGKKLRNKPELLVPLLGKLETSLKFGGETTLSTVYLSQYLHSGNRIPIIVFWNGTAYKDILNRLKLNINTMLNFTSYIVTIMTIILT